ncbi:ATP-binding protein [Ligilactobacillus equi]|nr:ATP-binding protein [Ligilactobacillus equi]
MILDFNGNPFCQSCSQETLRAKLEHDINQNKPGMRVLNFRSYWPYAGDIKQARFENSEVTTEEARNNVNKMLNMANRYLDKKVRGNTILTGKAGHGKSWVAAAALRYVAEHTDQECLFISWINWTRDYNDARQGRLELKTTLKRIISADLVVLDDIGAEFGADSGQKDNLTDALEYILENRDRTIITTNLKTKELRNGYQSSRALSRMLKGIKKKDGSIDDDRIIVYTDKSEDLRPYG